MKNLLKAIINYPEGTKFIGACNEYVSTGDFGTWRTGFDELKKGSIWRIEEGRYSGIVFDSENNKWGEIIPEKQPSILDGNCAIQVNNEREFKLLMEHYESKGWEWSNGDKPLEERPKSQVARYYFKTNIEYKDNTQFNLSDKSNDIPFADFAKEIGITLPVFIMKSEDGVDLYKGDEFWGVYKNPSFQTWHIKEYNLSNGAFKISKKECEPDEDFPYITSPSSNKAFSTKEAAEKWIEEQNKPKSIMLSEETPYPIEVGPKYLVIHCKNTDNHLDNIIIKDYEIKEIWEAYQSLQ